MTKELFREDGYLKSCAAVVAAVDEERGVVVDQTVFYPRGGGQPGDTGVLLRADGERLTIVDSVKDPATGDIRHLISEDSPLPDVGERVTLEIDWERRHRLMRMHSCMHLLCAVVPAGVTGGSVRDGSARLDFDLPDPPDKLQIEAEVNRLISEDHPMSLEWITDEELEQQPELIRTMSVKPPMGAGRVRLVRFKDVDLQPCGGTHVASTAEIGPVRIKKIEKKGKRNRRITVVFAED
jgi:misacylated tRNA(Ala) deacylase